MTDAQLMKLLLAVLAGCGFLLPWWWFRSHRRQLLLAYGAFVLALVLAELGLRVLAPQQHQHDDLFVYDSKLGWRFRPDQNATVVYSGEASHRVRTNSDGHRDPSFERQSSGKNTVWVLGDSFVSNLSVPDEAVFTQRMEQQLPDTTVLNFGVNGYGQTQELLLLREILATATPQLIIQVIYLRNDFADNLNSDWLLPRPRAEWHDGELRFRPPPAFQPRRHSLWNGLQRSHLLNLVNHRVNDFRYRWETQANGYRPTGFTPPELYLCAREPWDGIETYWETLVALLTATHVLATEENIPILFVLAPSYFQVDAAQWQALLESHGEPASDYHVALPNERLLQQAQVEGWRMLDLLPMLSEHHSVAEPLYYAKDQHWTSAGNERVAQALVDYLLTEGLLSN